MNLKKYPFLHLIIFTLLFAQNAFGQNSHISVIDISLNKESQEVAIVYEFEEKKASKIFEVQVYCSIDKYKEPLKMVSGDVGDGIIPTGMKEIKWKYQKEFPDQEGKSDIAFRIFVKFLRDSAVPLDSAYVLTEKAKAGKMVKVFWKGGKLDDNIEIRIVGKADKRTLTATKLPNHHLGEDYEFNGGEGKAKQTTLMSADVKLPKTMKRGSDYRLVVSNGNSEVSSFPIKVKPKPGIVQYAVLAGTVAVVGTAVLLLTSDEAAQEEGIGEPPMAPTN